MKYIVIDGNNGDEFIDEFSTKDEAIKAANNAWEHLTESERSHRDYFFILESVNPDEDAADHYDGDFIKVYKKGNLF